MCSLKPTKVDWKVLFAETLMKTVAQVKQGIYRNTACMNHGKTGRLTWEVRLKSLGLRSSHKAPVSRSSSEISHHSHFSAFIDTCAASFEVKSMVGKP